MEIQSKTVKIIIFIIINFIMVFVLYNIPIENNLVLENLCLYKQIFGQECCGCGMTRAFLSILHCDFNMAMWYNKNSVIVFPMAVLIYLYSWNKYIFKRKCEL